MKANFWSYSGGPLKVDPERLLKFLNEEGIYKYVPKNVDSFILVKVEDNRVRQVSPDEIREHCWKYVENNESLEADERRQALDQLYKNTSLFNRRNMSLLKEMELKEVKDTSDKSYMFFNNVVFEITADSVKKIQYSDLDGHVFMSDIINFDFTSEIKLEDKLEGEFYEFMKDICKHQASETEKQNMESLISIIGYLLHRYKDPANAKAMIFMDSYKDGTPNGGTGKGLLMKAFENIRSYEHADGKFYKTGDKFALSNIKYGTRIFTFDDVPEDFNFEKIFPLVTEKAVVERKYENKFSIPYEDSPKIAITTNYTVEGKGDSFKRRKIEFILSDTFHAEYTPEDKFGHLLYNDWEKEEWEKFYRVMIWCIQSFLIQGLVKPNFNVAERKLKQTASAEFIDFFSIECFQMGKADKKRLYDSFYSNFPNHYQIEMNTFTRWIKLFADANGFDVHESHSGEINYVELT